MKSWSEINFLWGSQNLWWARPSIAFWDWDWDFCIVVSKFETDTETFEISLKFWDWYWDFWQVVSKLETGLETTLVSVSVSRPKSRSSLLYVYLKKQQKKIMKMKISTRFKVSTWICLLDLSVHRISQM